MTQLEERLRADLRAESEKIGPGGIPALQLPARGRPADGARRTGPRHWPAWVTTLAAAAAVAVVIAGSLLVAHVLSGSGPGPAATGGPPYSGVPPYYAYADQGSTFSRTINGTEFGDSVVARYVKIRATATGKLLRTVSPPAPYNAFESFAGAANGRTFVFATHRDRYDKKGNEYYTLDQKTPLEFLILRITAGGHTELSPISVPGTLTEAQAPTLALSPDGTKLAVAYGGKGKPAVVRVITLATGQMRQWTSAAPAATPVLGGPGGWTSDGRTLALGLISIARGGRIRSTPTQMRLLDTTAPGTSLSAASRLVTLRGAGGFPWPFITPDGTKLLGEMIHQPGRAGKGTESGALGVYSARTGKLLQVIGRWQQARGFSRARPAVVWSDPSGSRLIAEIPRGKASRIGVLTEGELGPLPHVALEPLLFAINSGGFQTDGGYVGFAW